MDTTTLKEMGLTNNEINVYLVMLKEDENLASAIADKTKINRSLVYTILNSLINKGIINYVIKENRKYFRAGDPKKILDIVEEKEQLLKKQKEKIIGIIPDLRKLKSPKKEEFTIEIYRGVEGFKTVLGDILKEKKDYQMIGYTNVGYKITRFWFEHWHKKRIKLKIKRKVLFPNKFKGHENTKIPLTEARFLPKDYLTPTSIVLYGKKAIIFLPMENDFAGIIIKSKEIIESFKNQFNVLWNLYSRTRKFI